MNDAPVDVVESETTDPKNRVKGVTLPLLGVVAFLEHNWSEKFATAVGYSMLSIG